MKQKYKKIVGFLALSLLVANFVMVTAAPVVTYAQAPANAGAGEKSIAEYLCVPGTVTLYDCINRLYRFSLAAAFFVTVLFIVFAGYQYMVGGEKAKEDAKSRISSAVIAIVILSTSYILLRQINPELVKFKDISPLPATLDDTLDTLDPLCSENNNQKPCRDLPGLDDPDGGNAAPGTGGGTSKDHEDTSCAKSAANCTTFNNIDCKNNCTVQDLLAVKINELLTKSNPPYWRITEAYPPTITHKDGCHATGACVDMAPKNGTTFDQLCGAINQVSGLGIWNESGSTTQACGQDHTSGNTTGGHLHVYLTN